MTLDASKPVQGIAVYGEFVRSNATTQIIVTPDGFDVDGNNVGMCIVRRTITSDNPRKQWKFSFLSDADAIPARVAAGTVLSIDDAKEAYCDERMRYASTLFDQIMRGDWLLVKEPVLVEVSKIDLGDVRKAKTPTKLIYRIGQCRTALGFPADLINATVPTPTAV